MNARSFLDALNQIDDQYVREADVFKPVYPTRESPVFRALSWVAGAAACLAVLIGLCFLGKYGLLDELPNDPDPSPVMSQSAKVDSALQAEQSDPGEFAEDSLPSTECEAGGDLPGLVPAELLPELNFPTEEEFARVDDGTRAATSDCRAYEAVPMTREQILSIWGTGELAWAGLPLESDEWAVSGDVTYDEEGKLLMAEIFCSYADGGEGDLKADLSVIVTPERIRSQLGTIFSLSHTSEAYGTEIEAFAQYDPKPGTGKNGELYQSASYQTAFLRETGGEPLGVRATARCLGGGDFPSREEIKELLARLAWQCLNPENTFTLEGLKLIAEDGLPKIDFSAVSQRKESEVTDPSTLFGNTMEAMGYYRLVGLSDQETASLWGQDALYWEGKRVDSLYALNGRAFLGADGDIMAVTVEGYGSVTHDNEEFISHPVPMFYVNLFPGGLPEDDFFEGRPTSTTEIMGVPVEACKTQIDTGEPPAVSLYQVRFQTGSTGQKSLGVEISAIAAPPMDGEPRISGYRLEEDQEKLISQCVCQCLEPGSVLTTETLKLAVELSQPELEEEDYYVRIDKDGNLSEGGYPSTFPIKGYYGFQEGRSVLTGDDAVSEAADDSCVQVLRLTLPLSIVKPKEIEPAEGENGRELYALYSVDYGFFEREGGKVIEPVGGYGDVAGIITTPRGGAVDDHTWYPKDGTEYFPSIAEFLGGDESAAEQAVQQAHDWPKKADAYAEALLLSYMEQNGMTGWVMYDYDAEVPYPFGPQDSGETP